MTAYRKHYSPEQARRYASLKEADRRTHGAELKLVQRAFRLVPRGESVLDIPCGSGRIGVHIARWGFRVAGADVSAGMLGVAQERFRAEKLDIGLSLADLEGTGFRDRAFDNVFCFRLFHHFPDDRLRQTAARELCRLARRRVLVSYLDARSWTCRRRALTARMRRRPLKKFAQRPAEAAAYFTANGFRLVADFARLPWIHSLRLLVLERVDPF